MEVSRHISRHKSKKRVSATASGLEPPHKKRREKYTQEQLEKKAKLCMKQVFEEKLYPTVAEFLRNNQGDSIP